MLTRFKGMTEAESKPIVDYLMARRRGRNSTAACAGEQGTLGMWANPFVLHTAINDYPSYRRVMYRTTIEGWVPLGRARPEGRRGGLTGCLTHGRDGRDARRCGPDEGASSQARLRGGDGARPWRRFRFSRPRTLLLGGVIVLPALYVALAQPHLLDLRPGADLRRPRQLPRTSSPTPISGARSRNTVADRAWSSSTSSSPLGLGMALLFASGLPFRRLLLAAVLAPYAVSEVTAAVMWRFLFDPDVGPVTRRAARPRPADPRLVVRARRTGSRSSALLSIWLHLPFTFLILYAARLAIPDELYEAARIDGATPLQTFRRVTLPLLVPAMLVAMLFRYIFAFRLFSEVWLMTQGGPARSTEVVGGLPLPRGLPLQRLRRRRRDRLDHGRGLARCSAPAMSGALRREMVADAR